MKDGYEIYPVEYKTGVVIYKWRELGDTSYIIGDQLRSIEEIFDSEYINAQLRVMSDSIVTAPYQAISKAKELVESCVKTILDEHNKTYCPSADVNRLVKDACECIGLSKSKAIPSEDEIMNKIVGGLNIITQGLSELRNQYGDGHGKPADYEQLDPEYAELAVKAAAGIVNFMWKKHRR